MTPAQRAAIRRALDIGRYLDISAQHFRLSKQERIACHVAAEGCPAQALACYRAIARSLVKR